MTTRRNRHLMPTLLALLLSLCGCTTRRSASVPPVDTGQVKDIPTSSPTAPPGPRADTDPFAPFPVSSQLEIPLPDHLYAGGFEPHGSLASPVNTEEKDRDFFTDPAFDKKGNSGRLFSSITSLSNKFLASAPEKSVAFICWQPLVASGDDEGAMMAQLLPPRDGYIFYEVTTDGKRLFVQFGPAYESKKVDKPVDVYVWKGDSFGKGRFVPNDNKPFPKLQKTPLKEYESERDRGYEALAGSEPDEAIEAFQRAIQLKPEDAASHYGLGVAWEESSQLPEPEKAPKILAAFSRAVELDPKRIDAWRARGLRYAAENKWDKAVLDATKVIALQPKDAVGYIERAQYYAHQDAYDRAAEDALTATRLNPEEREYWEYAALQQYHAGRYDEAMKSAHRALDQDDARNKARLVLSYIYARRGQTEKALQQIKGAYDNGIGYSEREDGAKEIRKALQAQPKSAALHALNRAVCRNDQFGDDNDNGPVSSGDE